MAVMRTPHPRMSDLHSGALSRKTTGVGASEWTRAQRRSLRRMDHGEPPSETTQVSSSQTQDRRVRTPRPESPPSSSRTPARGPYSTGNRTLRRIAYFWSWGFDGDRVRQQHDSRKLLSLRQRLARSSNRVRKPRGQIDSKSFAELGLPVPTPLVASAANGCRYFPTMSGLAQSR
jgi:hypothetical protein